MEATELRIGNYFIPPNTGTNESATVMYLGLKQGIEIFINSHKSSECKPIPLTEELLLRFGFEENPDFDRLELYKQINVSEIENRVIYLTFMFDKNHKLLFKKMECSQERDAGNNDWCDYDININYVHQLQNLYFALTGKELNYTA